jgi:translation initiation factor 3 subunit E
MCCSFSSDVYLAHQNVIEINRPPLPIYQTVIEKTRGLALRTQALGAAVARTGQQSGGGGGGGAGGVARNETQAPAVAVN